MGVLDPCIMKRKFAGALNVVKRTRVGATAGAMAARYGGAAMARAGAGGLARLAGRAVPYVGAALTAYDGYKAARSLFSKKKSGQRAGSGRDGGRFKRPRKNSKKNMNYVTKGFVHTTEVHGLVADPDCVYVGHSSFSGTQMIEIMCQSLLRKLFAKSGWVCRSIHEKIPGYFANTSTCWRISIERKNEETGVIVAYNYDGVGATDHTIYQLVGDQSIGLAPLFVALLDVFRDFATGQGGTGGSTNNVDVPFRLRLYREEGNVLGTFYQFDSEIIFAHETVNYFSKSDLKIQNRTIAADSSTDANNVANNPIQGKLYHFKGGCPRAKVDGVHLVEAMLDRHGTLTARAAQIAPTDTSVAQVFKEPPKPHAFWNCSKSSTVKLNPGDTKSDSLYYSGKMPFLKFLKAIQYGYGTGLKQVNLFGKSAMIALEDMINVNAAANINIAYEVNREYGMYFTSKVPRLALGHRYSITVSNVPA